MSNLWTRRGFLVGLVALGVLCFSGSAQAQDKEELKKSFLERLPALDKLKDDGKVGERWDGFVEATEEQFAKEDDIAKLVAAENADRKLLYAIFATEEGTDAGLVAKKNGERNFQRAKSGAMLKTEDGRWRKKK